MSLWGMVDTLINVLCFFSVSSQCDIQSRILPGYGYVVYSVFTCIVRRVRLGYIHFYIVYSIYRLKHCSTFSVVFQLIKTYFAIRITVVNVFLFLTQSHI